MATMTTVEGKVTRTNDKGLQIAGRDGWLNISKFANELDCPMPKVGQTVRLTLDKSGYIREIAPVVDAPATMQVSAPTEDSATAQTPVSDDRKQQLIVRQCVLKVAADLATIGGMASNVEETLSLAARLENWVLR